MKKTTLLAIAATVLAATIANAEEGKRSAAIAAKVHHALNSEIMAQCNRMVDTPAIDWAQVAALRGVTVSINDCVKASAGLAAEYEK
jgi:hypothetical protein